MLPQSMGGLDSKGTQANRRRHRSGSGSGGGGGGL